MVLANLALTVNNALVKLTLLHLPPLETMFLRALAAVVLGLPLLAVVVSPRSLRHVRCSCAAWLRAPPRSPLSSR
jgi:hypothetical protein